MRPEISAAIRQAFTFAPPVPRVEVVENAAAFGSEVLVMMPFRVTESPEVRGVARAIAEKELKPKVEAFNFEDGGTIKKIGPAELRIKYSPERKGWDILNMRW